MKHSVTFRLDCKANLIGEVLILVILTFANIRMALSTGVHIRPDCWDAANMRPVKGCKNAAGQDALAITAAITARAAVVDKIFDDLARTDKLSRQNIKEAYRASQSAETPVVITESRKVLAGLDQFVAEMSILREWTPATKEKFSALANHLRAVDADMTFDELDEKGLIRLLEHFRTVVMPDGSFGMRNTTIKKQFEYLGWFMNWAVKKGITTNDAYRTFTPSLKQTTKKVIYLTEEELNKLVSVDLSVPNRRHLERVRDIFLFQCYSGFRYSDVQNLRWSDIRNGVMTITMIKTTNTIAVELNQHTLTLAEKYRPYQFPGDKVFPVPTNQEMNRLLKELCRFAGIDDPITVVYYKGKERIEEVKPKYELIGTHAGRRTFVVRALSLGISPYIVMRWTGHSSFNAMKPYMDIVDSAKAEAMQKFNI